MKINYFVAITLIFYHHRTTGIERSRFDTFIPQLRMLREIALQKLQPASQFDVVLRKAEVLNKLQPKIRADALFPCSVKYGRSKIRPNNVNKIRPGDIDVIGAIGDSLTAGNGLVATSTLEVLLENRGLSYAIGGQGTWREFVTLPNILKEFNPNLIGYSLESGFTHQKSSQFNLAEAGAMSRDTPFMAEVLVSRIKNDPRVDIQNHWKMISVLIGCNDFCVDICYYRDFETPLKNHKKDLLSVLRTLKDNLPRTIVNLIITPHLRVFANASVSNRPPQYYFTQNVFCPCLIGLQFQQMQRTFDEIMSKWQEIEFDIANDSEFDTDNFTVVAQPFAMNYSLSKLSNGLNDYSVLSEDCFHLSQKENARAATSLWNNIIQPVGKKSNYPTTLFNFKCPNKRKPYIFTKRNSKR